MASGKVLILDESHATRTQLRELLPKGQYEIQEASDGERGLSLIQQERSNIRFIILDSALPKVNGWDVVERLQADVELQKIPLVMMGSAQSPTSSYPMVEFLQKPFRKKELRTVVKSAIGKAISVHQEAGNDRQEESILSPSDRQEAIVEESIATVQTPEEGTAIDLDNMFESFVESERDRAESDEFLQESAESMESRDSGERELDFSFDTTGTDKAIDKEEIAELGLSFLGSDPAISTENSQEENPESLEFEVEPTEIKPIVEIDPIISLEGKGEDIETDFSFDTTGTDETIDTREFKDLALQSDTLSFSSALDSQDIVDEIDDEEPEIDEFPSLDIDLSTEDLSPEIDEFPSLGIDLSLNTIDDEEPEIDEFPSLDIDLSTEDLSPEIDEFPSLDIDLSTEDLNPEIDEFPSLDIDPSGEDLSPKIDEFSSLDIDLSTEDLEPEIDEFPSLDIDSSTEDLSPESDEFPSLDISTKEVENQFYQEEEINIEDEQKEISENFELIQNRQDLNRQDWEEELEIEENTELFSSDNTIFNLEGNAGDRQNTENVSPSFELEELSNETDLADDANISEFSVEELLTPVHEWSEDDFTAEYTSEETEALIDESFADLGTEELATEIPESEENDLMTEYTSEETEALIDESFSDLGTEELATEIPESEENDLMTEYTSEETEALIDESFADLGT
ncbi:MAG: response regulator, partial [Cyanobacteria bacterium P01_E01_bin.42]